MKSLRSVLSCHWKPLFGVFVAILFGTTLAESAEDFDQRVYIGFGAGISELDPESMCPCLTVGDGNDQAFNVFLGIDLSRRLTVEAYYADLGEAGIRFNGGDVGPVEYQVAGVSALGYLFASRLQGNAGDALAQREGLSAYLRLGVGLMENQSRLSYDRDHKVHQHAGVGLEYGWSNGLAVRAEVVAYDSDAAFAGVTVLKRFGQKTRPAPPEKTAFSAVAEPQVAAALPPPPPPVAPVVEPELPSTTYFAFGKYDLTPQTLSALDKLVPQLLEAGTMESGILSIEGHTDEIDTEEYNMRLSINRATAVRNYLVSQGVDPARLQIRGYGETRPIASNLTLEGRSLNRRVEIYLR